MTDRMLIVCNKTPPPVILICWSYLNLWIKCTYAKSLFRKKDECQFYDVATQIKLLLDTPEKVWSAIDTGNYLQATQLYLLARHINTALQLDSQQSAKIHSWFPVLARQWAAISHFRATILQGCKEVLKNADISEQVRYGVLLSQY